MSEIESRSPEDNSEVEATDFKAPLVTIKRLRLGRWAVIGLVMIALAAIAAFVVIQVYRPILWSTAPIAARRSPP